MHTIRGIYIRVTKIPQCASEVSTRIYKVVYKNCFQSEEFRLRIFESQNPCQKHLSNHESYKKY